MRKAYLNHIAAAVPEFDIHEKFVEFGPSLLDNERNRLLFKRMAERCQIDHRYSCLKPHPQADILDAESFYQTEAFPGTGERMRRYKEAAFALTLKTLDQMGREALAGTTHIIVTSCTGFYAPGIDLQIVNHYSLNPAPERTIIGFMGCYAAVNALKMARHIVRSDGTAKVLIVNLELCTLHLRNTGRLEDILCFLLFADGCAASIVSAEPRGLELQSFHAAQLEASEDQITWHVGDAGFDMGLSGRVPATIAQQLAGRLPAMLNGGRQGDFRHWAIHPGGRTVLDAVQESAGLGDEAMNPSREILRRYGNMSSPSIMFVLQKVMQMAAPGSRGCAMAFGPGISVESFVFEAAGP